jgi:hemolysin activation/secretion protein
MRLGRVGFAFCAIHLLFPAGVALAQTAGPRIIDTLEPGSTTNALPSTTINPAPGSVPSAPTPAGSPAAGGEDEKKLFVLRAVQVEGATHVTKQSIAAVWQGKVGSSVSLADLRQIADGISGVYKKAGYALYTVSIPKQSFRGGVVVIRVAEGYVDTVSIQDDDKTADLSLINAYAAPLVAERPLRQATLERYILLMTDLSGHKVGSRFEPVAGKPGANLLVLTVQTKKFDAGFGFVNLGTPLLSDTQFAVNGLANSLLREGDRTQIVYGFAPDEFHNYQYYGINHQTPLGDDGLTLQLNAGYLSTDVNSLIGRAYLVGVHVNDPLIRSVDENLFLNVGLDGLNSDDAILGSSASDEHTRALRATLAYALKDDFDGTNTAIGTLSDGLSIFDARRGSLTFGGPVFVKFNTRVERDQKLPWDFVFRLRAAGQISGGHLPQSEQFSFGGEDFGRAFDYDTLNGDRGFATAGELAYEIGPYHPYGTTVAPEVYVWSDWGMIWNVDTLLLPASDRGASAGLGTRATIADQTIISLELARDLERPLFSPSPPDWRVVFTIRRAI